MNLITRFVLSLILVTFSSSSFSNDESSEEEITIKIRDVKVGYIHPKYRHQAGTNLE